MAEIVCILKTGGDYRPEHVKRLAGMVPGLVCLSDVDVPGVECRPLLDNLPGWWSKMEAFGPSVSGDMLLIDLDTTVLRVPDMPTETTVLDDFYRPRLMGSGFMYVTEADRALVWAEWRKDPAKHMKRCVTREAWGDQGFLMPIIGNRARWGKNVVSWKVHCQKGIPEGTDVICFHGKPRPWDVWSKSTESVNMIGNLRADHV